MNFFVRLGFRLRGLLHFIYAGFNYVSEIFVRFISGVHISPPGNDYALQVPFARLGGPATTVPSVAVICHMFYVDLAAEFLDSLGNIPFPFDLYITTDEQEKKTEIERVFSSVSCCRLEVRIAPNCGRDIAPKLIACADVYDRYEFFLHIHTKKSPHGSYLEGWREYLLAGLIGSPDVVLSVFDIFNANSEVGIIAPQHLEILRPGLGWGLNFKSAKVFAQRLGLTVIKSDLLDFPSGSMFWARSAALKPLLDCNLQYADFPLEQGQTDGTTGHIIERLYFLVCEAAGYKYVKIANAKYLDLVVDRTVVIESRADFDRFILIHTPSLAANIKRGHRV